jgi:hypothetical protein
MTSPNMTCLSSRWGVGVHVMKNCEPLVFGPALACALSDEARERRYGLRGCGAPWREGRVAYAWQRRLHPRTSHHRWIRRQFLKQKYIGDQSGYRHHMTERQANRPFPAVKSPPWIMNLRIQVRKASCGQITRTVFMWQSCAHFLMTRWKPLSLYHNGFPDSPMPFSPVQSAPVSKDKISKRACTR